MAKVMSCETKANTTTTAAEPRIRIHIFAKAMACASNRPESHHHRSNSYDASNDSKGHGNLAGRIILEVSRDGTAITTMAQFSLTRNPARTVPVRSSVVIIINRWAWGEVQHSSRVGAFHSSTAATFVCSHRVPVG
jgi:hypothetical protein